MSVRIIIAASLSLLVAGCGSADSGSPAGTDASSGGASATGGAGSGGLSGSGGASSSGGHTSSGGSTGSGGVIATGGVPTAGGGRAGSGGASSGSGGVAPGSGGVRGSGGSASTGGSNGSGGTNGSPGSGGIGGTGGRAGAVGGAGASGSGGIPGHAGSSAAGSAGGGTGGAAVYKPCPTNGDPCKILPLGDSITHGHGSSDDGGYRSQLFKLIVAANQKVTFTGSLTNGPTQVSGQTFPRTHEGHDGWTIDPGYSTYGSGGISSLVPSPAFDGKPHIVLLHIGTNDTDFMDSANMSTRLESLLDKIAQASPTSLIVLAQLTPLGYANSALTTYNGRIPGIIQTHAARGQHIVGVDMTKMPGSDIASDNVHPNDQGYAYMATIWYAALKDLLSP